jgi:hypothetical protein
MCLSIAHHEAHLSTAALLDGLAPVHPDLGLQADTFTLAHCWYQGK